MYFLTIGLQRVGSISEKDNCAFEKVHGGIAALFFIGIDKTLSGRFFNHGVLVVFLPILAGITGIWHIFHVHLPFFAENCWRVILAGMFGFLLC